MNRVALIVFVLAGLLLSGQARGGVDSGRLGSLVTEAEASGFARATPLAVVVEIVDRLGESGLVSVGSIGRTHGGREIPVMVVADPPVAWGAGRPAEGAGGVGDRLVVLLFGSIHAGEVCGSDGLLMLVRDLVTARGLGEDTLLDDLVLCVVPVYNADGHANRAAGNRAGQNGPAEMGERANGQGLDLNRDWVKMDAPETRAMVGFLNAWDPEVIVDTHTTNGSKHRFTLTYQGPKHPAGDAGVIGWVRDEFLPAVDARFEAATGYDAFFYGNFAEGHTKWTTYPAEPWYGVAYRGLRGRVSVLTEAYAYATFEDRVRSTEAFCREVLREAAARKAEIRALVDGADDRAAEAGRVGAAFAVKTEARAFVEKAELLGYEEYDEAGERVEVELETAEPRSYALPVFNDFVATEVVARPAAYVVPAGYGEVIDRLRGHGVRLHVVGEGGGGVVEAGVYRVVSVERSERAWQNRKMMSLEVELEAGSVEVRAGDVIVRTDQALGTLAAYMLEPRATGGLAAWGFFPGLVEGGGYPVVRLGEGALEGLAAD